MSYYAFSDKNRKNKILAEEALELCIKGEFYCPNPNCDARLILCSRNGISNPYFRAKPSHKHVTLCPYGSKAINFKKEHYDESQFNGKEALKNLCIASSKRKSLNSYILNRHRNIPPSPHPPRTLHEIYSMCKSYDPEHIYGDVKIADIILDNRSIFAYISGIKGYKIVEATIAPHFYNKSKNQIFLETPVTKQKYKVILNIETYALFSKIRNILFHNYKKDNGIVIVVGDWINKENNTIITTIKTKRQLLFIK